MVVVARLARHQSSSDILPLVQNELQRAEKASTVSLGPNLRFQRFTSDSINGRRRSGPHSVFFLPSFSFFAFDDGALGPSIPRRADKLPCHQRLYRDGNFELKQHAQFHLPFVLWTLYKLSGKIRRVAPIGNMKMVGCEEFALSMMTMSLTSQ
uniref:Uncharacterized protein n=1 Tax=Coccidioides posadasii RMSCC 3488 TaxID=454284 RepID=A0A0J6FLL5_COCPO|nr:hypothetical protein CPAG_06627 [Coccidioides posadasii RMSCC 3488]